MKWSSDVFLEIESMNIAGDFLKISRAVYFFEFNNCKFLRFYLALNFLNSTVGFAS